MTDSAPAFRLIDSVGVRTVPELLVVPAQVEVSEHGAAGVVSALANLSAACLIRDPSMPLPDTQGGGLWLQTSGTTGAPKWVRHEPERLNALISQGREKARWLLTYHPGSFAGLQVILSALKGGHDLVAPPVSAPIAEVAQWAVIHQVTHISATPTFWRAFLMALYDELPLKVVTLGGEAADQNLLDALRIKFPKATIKPIYATTETGVVFTISDGREGFPAEWLKRDERLSLTAHDTLSIGAVDSGDVIAIEGDRAIFRGRLDTMVNIGGTKVFPEAVEAHLLRQPDVIEARVSARPSPITGHILMAEIVARQGAVEIEQAVKTHLSQLPREQRPALIRYVTQLDMTQAGKKMRTL